MYNPSVFPEEHKEKIVKPLLGHNNKEFEGIAKFVMTLEKKLLNLWRG